MNNWHFSPSTLGFYPQNHPAIPRDAVEITDEVRRAIIDGQSRGQRIASDDDGQPILVERQPLVDDLCADVDQAADRARAAVAGDPLRAVEYDRARIEAEQFAANDYQGDVPPMVAAWAINGRTPQQAAESILHEAAQYTAALVQLRTVRLQAKEQIRAAMAEGNVEQAQQLTDQTIAAIEAAVAGIGNKA